MPQFPNAGGDMADAIRTHDWSATPLGALDQWPTSLLTTVRIMLAQKHAICIFWGPELTMLYNDAYAPFLGAKEAGALGKPFEVIWSDVWAEVKPLVDEALDGRSVFHREMPLVMQRNGYDEQTYWTFSYSPLYDDDAQVVGLMNVTVDATPTVQARENYEIMQRELVHRVKNTLAVTTAVVSSSLRHAATIEDARATVGKRMSALTKAQEFLNYDGEEIEIEHVVDSAIKAHLDNPSRAVISGSQVLIAPEQAVGLSLALYELATNAVKYGALSQEQGQVHITWALDDDRRFTFEWTESGGPHVAPPQRSGFGSRLTNVIVASYFGGTGTTHYDPSGLRFALQGQLVAR